MSPKKTDEKGLGIKWKRTLSEGLNRKRVKESERE